MFATIYMSAKEKLLGGIPELLFSYVLKALYMAPMLLLWQSLSAQGALNEGYTLPMLLAYTCLSNLLSQQLNIQTPISSWHYEGELIGMMGRPQGLFTQLMGVTIGGWLPSLMLFSLPMSILMHWLGIDLIPKTGWFFPSLFLSISLGFAVDFLYGCFVIRMKNAAWLTTVIRMAMMTLLSGSLIPFDLLPFGLGSLFRLLPFAGLASSPLVLFIGAQSAMQVIPLQIMWNLILWPLAFLAFNKSLEGMVSYGG